LKRVARLLRGAAQAAVDETTDEHGKHRLVAALSRRRKRPVVRTLPRLAYGFAAVCVAALAVVVSFDWQEPLDYVVSGAVADGGYVRANDQAADVTFSDGSVVRAEPGTRLRIADRSARGAHVILERGATNVHVVHEGNTGWSFRAGPYEVRVTGTRFRLAWASGDEVLDLRVEEGSVEVLGPGGAGPLPVSAGQTLRGEANRQRLLVMQNAPPRATDEGNPVAPAASSEADDPFPESHVSKDAAPAPTATSGVIDRAPGARSAPEPGRDAPKWSSLVARGDFERVVGTARQQGMESCLVSCSSAELSALADAARYTGRHDLAIRALRRSYDRFGLANSAFLLGRTFEGLGQLEAAEQWYRKYTERAPGGELAAEALAGRMRIQRARGGRGAALALAKEYLDRYPGGVHIKTARSIVQEQ
jgi:hypothetical protein